ncbi:MAG: GNAT family N-acetyltransferase, partial [Saprospiraceae bacterium]|nr:GNAT family N-acetyltransferase [Saprospiraceae bacterium]
YMVSPQAKGQGIGRSMGIHSLEQARLLGYHAMQFNFVVKTNTVAVNLWKSLGFEIVGEIPSAFKHQTLGYVNVYIMYKSLQ